MKKNIAKLLLIASTALCLNVQAEVKISTQELMRAQPLPDGSAMLEVESNDKGILIPRMTNTERNAIGSPAHSLIIYNEDLDCIQYNVGSPTAPEWQCLVTDGPVMKFFYAPSIPIDVSLVGTRTIDLYSIYEDLFGTPMASSNGTGMSIYAVDDMNYHILDYDTDVLSNVSIDTTGVMTYTVVNNTIEKCCSYINAVFEVK